MAIQSHSQGQSRTNRKSLYNFLLVINSNLGRILLCFRDIADFLLKTATPPLHFGDVSFGLDSRWAPMSENQNPKLIVRVITFEVT